MYFNTKRIVSPIVLSNFVYSHYIFCLVNKVLSVLIFACLFSFASPTIEAQQTNRVPYNFPQTEENGLIAVYPNPARDYIMVKTKDESVKIKQISFFSILGVQVADYKLNVSSTEIRLDKFRPGKYLMRYALSDNTIQVTQIIKQ